MARIYQGDLMESHVWMELFPPPGNNFYLVAPRDQQAGMMVDSALDSANDGRGSEMENGDLHGIPALFSSAGVDFMDQEAMDTGA